MTNRDSNGRFIRGSVGNPKGRPKKQPAPPTPEEVLENATMEAVVRLIDLVHSENEAIALHASVALLDRTIMQKDIPYWFNPNYRPSFNDYPIDYNYPQSLTDF